jgi:hypothetical protein
MRIWVGDQLVDSISTDDLDPTPLWWIQFLESMPWAQTKTVYEWRQRHRHLHPEDGSLQAAMVEDVNSALADHGARAVLGHHDITDLRFSDPERMVAFILRWS